MTCSHLEMGVKADVSGKKKKWGILALLIRSKTGLLLKGRISASSPICTLIAEKDCKPSKCGWQKTPQSKGPLLRGCPAVPEERPGSSAPLRGYSWLPRVSGSAAGIRATWICYVRDMLLVASPKSQRRCYYVIGTIKQGSVSVSWFFKKCWAAKNARSGSVRLSVMYSTLISLTLKLL